MTRAVSWQNLLFDWAAPAILLVTAVAVVMLWRKDRQRRLALDARAVLLRPGPQVSDTSRHAIDLLRRVVALAEFLADRGVAATGLTSNYGAFGYWSLQLQHDAEIVEVASDEMDERLWITRPGRKDFELKLRRPDDPIAIAQDLLVRELHAAGKGETDSARMGIEFIRPLAAFAGSLAAEDVAVADLRCHSPSDVWWMDLRNGTTYERNIGVVRVIWNGRERNLSVAVSLVEKERAATQFRTEFQRTLEAPEDPIEVAREYLTPCFR